MDRRGAPAPPAPLGDVGAPQMPRSVRSLNSADLPMIQRGGFSVVKIQGLLGPLNQMPSKKKVISLHELQVFASKQ